MMRLTMTYLSSFRVEISFARLKNDSEAFESGNDFERKPLEWNEKFS